MSRGCSARVGSSTTNPLRRAARSLRNRSLPVSSTVPGTQRSRARQTAWTASGRVGRLHAGPAPARRAAGFRSLHRNGPDRGRVSPTPSGVALSSGKPEASVVVPVVGRVGVALSGAREPGVVVPAAAAQHAPLTLDGPYPSCHLTPPGAEIAATARAASPGYRRGRRCCGWRHSPPGVPAR